MFAGFRSRRAELQAAAVQEAGADSGSEMDSSDAVERLAVAATGAAAFFRRGDAAAPPGEAQAGVVFDEPAAQSAEPGMVIPGLVEDEDEFGDVEFTRETPDRAQWEAQAAPAPAQVEETPGQVAAPQWDTQPASSGWAPVKAWDEDGQAPAPPTWRAPASAEPQAPAAPAVAGSRGARARARAQAPAAPAWQAAVEPEPEPEPEPQAPAAPAWQAAVEPEPRAAGTGSARLARPACRRVAAARSAFVAGP